MDLFQLETFVALAETKSFSLAARKRLRTQRATSQAVRKLETDIGEPLLDPSSRNGNLTAAGELLLQYAEKLLNLRTEARGALTELRQLQSGRLSIAANEFTCIYLLRVLEQFRRQCPMIKVAVQRAFASHVPEDVAIHNVELRAISYKPDSPALRSIAVYRDELAFIVPPKHPLAGAREVRIRQLGPEAFAAHNVPPPCRSPLLQAFPRHKTPLTITL